jgi:peptidoglycan hydrolase CwlO-like protein
VLKNAVRADNIFCGNDPSQPATTVDTDDDAFRLLMFIVHDHVENKQRHYDDFRQCNQKVTTLENERDRLHAMVAELNSKLRTQSNAFKNFHKSEEDSKKFETQVLQYKKDIQVPMS